MVERPLLFNADVGRIRVLRSSPPRKPTLDAVHLSSVRLLGRPTGPIDGGFNRSMQHTDHCV